MAMAAYKTLFSTTNIAAIGMIHAKALPGTPLCRLTVGELVGKALEEAQIYKEAKIDGILIENMWDLPYTKSGHIGPEITATMTRIATEVRKVMPQMIPCGVQVLAGGNKEALAICAASGLQFIRAEGFVFSHVADEGWMDASAGELLRYRKNIGCEHVLVFADIKKKHSAHAITSDVSAVATAKAAEFFLADGIIVTGEATGMEADSMELESIKRVSNLPVLVGSGITSENIRTFKKANGVIVGSHFKTSGKWNDTLDKEKVISFMHQVKSLRESITS